MKKIYAILIALMVLGFTQCKPTPDPETNDENTEKVTVRCEIPINNGNRSDFAGLHNGTINWSNGTERVYLAIHGTNPKIIELTAIAEDTPSSLVFSGEAAKNSITSGEEYDVWYFGNSQQLGNDSYVNFTDGGLTGSIANQSGRLTDLGYCHIAKTTVTAFGENDVELNLNAQLQNQIAIAVLDLNNVSELYDDAIVGTEYTLAYNSNNGKYELDVTENSEAKISITDKQESGKELSYIVLFPNSNIDSEIRTRIDDNTAGSYKIYEYIFEPEIEAGNLYLDIDGEKIKALPWAELVSGEIEHDDHNHEYVDLGLSVQWATCNIGANTMEEYGNYYAWGEIETKTSYTKENYKYYDGTYTDEWGTYDTYIELDDISGNADYDVATATWGGDWRMPKYDEWEELFDNCTMYPVKTEGQVNGYMCVSKKNGNHIFLPAAGYKDGNTYEDDVTHEPYTQDFWLRGTHGYYWSSTPADYDSGAQGFYFDKFYTSGGEVVHYTTERWYGFTVRAVRDVQNN